MRTPFQEERTRDGASMRARMAEGFQFLWSQPFVRTCAFLFALGNFIEPGLLFAVVVIGKRHGLSGGEVGALIALFGGCLLLGSIASPLVRRLLPVRAVLLLELWMSLGLAAFLVKPSVYVLVAGMLPTALVIPSTDSVVHGYRIAITPDRLLGRSESVRSTISLLISSLGPLTAGVLLGAVSERWTIGFFAAFAMCSPCGERSARPSGPRPAWTSSSASPTRQPRPENRSNRAIGPFSVTMREGLAGGCRRWPTEAGAG
jgi:hypothetical protein